MSFFFILINIILISIGVLWLRDNKFYVKSNIAYIFTNYTYS